MTECPFCHRRLLSQGSPNCNWCGKEIPDAAYQQRAAVQREVYFAEEAIRDAVSLARIEAINGVDPLFTSLNPLTGLPLGVPRLPGRPIPPVLPPAAAQQPPTFGHAYGTPPAEAAPPQEEPALEPDSGDRFGHLEL